MTTLREDGQYDTTCPECGESVIVRRVHGEGDSVKTTDPENHSSVCRGKKQLKKRPQWTS